MLWCAHHRGKAKCDVRFHPSCALAERCYIEQTDHGALLYCEDHAPFNLYCVCRLPWRDSGGLQCETCKDWFHYDCVDIDEEDADKIAVYTCPNCGA